MALTGSVLIHQNSPTSGNLPSAGTMVQGQIAINSADRCIFIKDSTNAIVKVASATAVAKALSAAQTVNGQSPDGSGAVTITPSQIGTYGVAPLDSNSKISTVYLPDSILGSVDYKGTWDASTNTPTLPDPTTVKGWYYVVSTAGTQFGKTFVVGDWVISNGVIWDKVEAQDAVVSVNGKIGIVVLNAADVGALALTGGSVSGNITMTGGSTVTGLAAPVANSDAATKLYVDTVASSLGTVTSIDVISNDSSVLTATGGPVTASGTVTLDFATQAAGKIFAGPGTGSAAKPTFRSLVSSDIAGLTLDEGTF